MRNRFYFYKNKIENIFQLKEITLYKTDAKKEIRTA
jgi:hypothetical protein